MRDRSSDHDEIKISLGTRSSAYIDAIDIVEERAFNGMNRTTR